MKASELRIGNYVNDDSEKGLMIVSAIKSREYNEWNSGDAYSIVCLKAGYKDSYYEGDFKPIPLTPKWFDKFGLKYLQNACWEFGSMRIYNLSDEEKSRYRITLAGHELCILNYVHQLQNFYHSIKQTELTLSNP
jgi:hypothetical protein